MGMLDEGRWNVPLFGKKDKQANQPKPRPKPDKGNVKNPKKGK